MALPTALRPLRHRDFAVLALAGLVSNVGTWMQNVAVAAIVIEETGQAAWAALAAAAQFLPIGLLAPVGGALADRIPRKPFLLVGYLLATLLAAALALLAANDAVSPGVLVAITFAGGSLAALLFPFQQAIIPELVPPEDLVGAVSIGSAQFNLGRVVGPALAGIVIAATSVTWVFAINASTFLVVVVAFTLVTLRPPVGGTEKLLRSIRTGARAALTQPGCRAAMLLIAITAVLVSPFIALVSAVAELFVSPDAADRKADIAAATGTLVTVQGIGAVVGAFVLAPMTARIGHQRAFLVAVGGVCASLLVYAWSPTLLVAALAIFGIGFWYITLLQGLAAVVQLQAPDEFRGRIISLYFTSLTLIYPLGAIVHGTIADRVGLRETTATTALVMVAIIGWMRVRGHPALGALDGEPALGRSTPTGSQVEAGVDDVAGATA